MAAPEASNADFADLQVSVKELIRALDTANSQKTVRKGQRQPAADHKPLKELHEDVEHDLGRLLNSPLRPVTGPAYGCLPLEAVQPIRHLHKLLFSLVGPGGDESKLDDPDVGADLHGRMQAFVASVVPDHPFLKVKFEREHEGDSGLEEQDQEPTPAAKGKGKQAADDGQQQQQTPKKKGKGRQVVDDTLQAPAATPADGPRRSVRIIARRLQRQAEEQAADDEALDGVQLTGDDDGGEEPSNQYGTKGEADDGDYEGGGNESEEDVEVRKQEAKDARELFGGSGAIGGKRRAVDSDESSVFSGHASDFDP